MQEAIGNNAGQVSSENRRVRVFISSTFRDMLEERDALMSHACSTPRTIGAAIVMLCAAADRSIPTPASVRLPLAWMVNALAPLARIVANPPGFVS